MISNREDAGHVASAFLLTLGMGSGAHWSGSRREETGSGQCRHLLNFMRRGKKRRLVVLTVGFQHEKPVFFKQREVSLEKERQLNIQEPRDDPAGKETKMTKAREECGALHSPF